MLVTLAIVTLVLLAMFVGVAVVGGLLFVGLRQRLKKQHDDLLEALLEQEERGGRGK